MLTRPLAGDYAPFFQGYIDKVPNGDILAALSRQSERLHAALSAAAESFGDYRYADGKWTVKRLVQHVADGERMFCYRAMCIARGDTQDLPGFDENRYADHDGTATRTLASVADEYASVRAATLTLIGGFDDVAWQRRGTANSQPVAVRAMPWIVLGHDLHHHQVLVERYGLAAMDPPTTGR